MDHERDGGHTLPKHVRNKLEILHDKCRENTYISYFESAECAEEYTSRAMSANKDAIASWSSKAASREPLNITSILPLASARALRTKLPPSYIQCLSFQKREKMVKS